MFVSDQRIEIFNYAFLKYAMMDVFIYLYISISDLGIIICIILSESCKTS